MLSSIQFVPRNPRNTHWDVYHINKRVYRIRGSNGKLKVINIYGDESEEGTVPDCVKYIFRDILSNAPD